jgi:hypothetical protein
MFTAPPTEFLITSPVVQKLGPENILVKFAIYGETPYQVNRCLEVFAEVVRKHQGELHQAAVSKFEDSDFENGEREVSLDGAISSSLSTDGPIKYIQASVNDERYINDYIAYLSVPSGETRRVIDNQNTFASSKF